MRKALTYFLLLALPFASQGQPTGFISGRLADIAPTILSVMELPQPAEMTGRSLLK